MPGAEADYADNNILPVLNSLGEIEAWGGFARQREKALPAAVHLDSGMCRLGLTPAEVERLRGAPDLLAGIVTVCILSHLARSAERRVGNECVRQGRYRWAPYHSKKKNVRKIS